MKNVITAALVCSCAGTASANNLTGNDLHKMCNQNDGNFAYESSCAFWVIGAWEGLKFGAASVLFLAREGRNAGEINADVNAVLKVCAPESASWEQQIDIFKKHLIEHPETRHESARTLLIEAGREAFPCN